MLDSEKERMNDTDYDKEFAEVYDPIIDIEEIQTGILAQLRDHPEYARILKESDCKQARLTYERDQLTQLREKLETLNNAWDVVPIAPPPSGSGLRLRLKLLAGRIFGMPARLYFRPQTDYNAHIVRTQNQVFQLLTLLTTRIEAQNEKILSQETELMAFTSQYKRQLREIDEGSRYLQEAKGRIEESLRKIDSDVGFPADFDYTGFEDQYRGSFASIKNRITERYLTVFERCVNVLDLGCGRGEFLSIMNEHGIHAIGVDNDSRMVERCIDAGYRAIHEDAIRFVEESTQKGFDGIFCAQMIEHISSIDLMRFVRGCYSCLQPSGKIVLETINPLSLSAYRFSFPMDITHKKLVHPFTLKFILESIGFTKVDLCYFTPAREAVVIPEGTPNEIRAFVEDLENAVFGELDYAVVAVK